MIPDVSNLRTGTLRQDIEIIPPGRHGAYPMIFDPATESYFKLTVPVWKMLKKYDRDCTVEEFGKRLKRAGIPAEQHEILQVRQFLAQNNLLTPDPEDFSIRMKAVKEAKNKHIWLKIASAYLYFKLPPLHPQPFIDMVKPYIGFIGSKYFVWSLIIPAVIGYLLILRDLPGILATLEASFTWAGLVKYFFAVIVLKIIHEAGHLAANMRFNCRVRAIGISVIFLYPRFYSDTTDSWRLPRKQRLLIDAGGLIAEMICGGWAALAWSYLAPGNLQSTMFFIFAVSTASTLLVNGNPLIRFDGYYILCDLLGVENLMQRSGEFIKQLSRHYLFGLGGRPQDERPYLMTSFGIAAFIYRFLLYTSIILVIYNSMIKAVAIVLLILEVFTIFILPCYNEVRIVRALSKHAGRRANLTFAAVLVLALLFVLLFPLSWRTRLPGETGSSSSVLVTAPEQGFLVSAAPQQPVDVKKGDIIMVFTSPVLELEIQRRTAGLKELELLYSQQLSAGDTMGDSTVTYRKILSEKRVISDLRLRQSRLQLFSPADGCFVPAYSDISIGVTIPQGAVLGAVNSRENTVSAYASDDQLQRISPGMKVDMRFKDHPRDIRGTIVRINPVPAVFEPSPLLKVFGGEIEAVRTDGKKDEFVPEHSMFRVEIVPDEKISFQSGRTLRVLVRNREILFDKLVVYILNFLRQEF